MTSKPRRMNNNTYISQVSWLAYTANDFVNRVKILAQKHGVIITSLDIARKQIYFSCEYDKRHDFAMELNDIVNEFKRIAPQIFDRTKIQTTIKTVYGWIKDKPKGEDET